MGEVTPLDRMTIRNELRDRIDRQDPSEVPVPGFPSHDDLVAWARTVDVAEVTDAAVEVLLGDGPLSHQYAAMGLLRRLGVEVRGEGYDGSFTWVVG